MAPEQARGEKVDLRADVYGIGACMYHALAGRAPFDAPTAARLFSSVCNESPPPLGSLRPDLDGALIGIIDRAMARDPAHRYPSARSMMSAIGAFLRGEPLPTDPMSAYTQAPPSPMVQSPRVASGEVRVRGPAYELARTGAASPFSGMPYNTPPPPTTGPGNTLTPNVPNVHPGSGGGIMVAPYALPSIAPQERSSFLVTFVAMSMFVIAAGIGVGVYFVRTRASSTAAPVPAASPTTPPSAMLVAESNPMTGPTEIATLSPIGTQPVQHGTNPTPTFTAPAATIPSNASYGQLVQAMVSAYQAKDGRGCLDAYDRMKQAPEFSDASNSYLFMHAQCAMYAGRCDEGRREMTTYFSQLKSSTLSPDQVAATVGAQAQMSCPASQLTSAERAQKALSGLSMAIGAKDTAKELRMADELAAEVPHLPQSTEDERRKLVSYEYMMARAYADNGRCDQARRHFRAECTLTSAPNPDQCVTGLINSSACRGQQP
jgi:hypothetical protein